MPPRSAGPTVVHRQVAIEQARLSPEGTRLAYARRTVVNGTYRSHLWLVPFGGGQTTQLTRGAVRDLDPRFSPDGRRLAFIRRRAGSEPDPPPSQVWILPLDGGEPWQLTNLRHGVGSVSWSPDGCSVAVTGWSDEPRFIVGPVPKAKPPRARRMTRLDFRDDEAGYLDHWTHLWIVPVRPGATPRRVTHGEFDVGQVAWAPDGSRLAFVTDRGPDRNIAPRTTIWSVPAARGEPREVAALRGDADHPSFSPDGRWLAFIGTDVEDPPDHVQPAVWVVPTDGAAGGARCLTAGLDLPAGTHAWSDLLSSFVADEPGPDWLDDETLVVLLSRRARCLPYLLSLAGSGPEPLVDPERRVVAAGMAVAAGRVAVLASVDGRAAEVHAVERRGLRPVTRNGSAWQSRYASPELRELEIGGPAGAINTWLASPPGASDRRLPLVLHIHGGPTGAFGGGATLDALVLTGAGYRVAMPNIRGSATFGADWIQQLSGRWGEVDAQDAMAVVDHLVAAGLADERRLALLGLSYGGYLVQWLITSTDRFNAAVAENGVANHVSSWANSYFGVHYNRRASLGDPLTEEGMLRLWQRSPLARASAIRTPLLLLQAEEDRICPAADNEQLFTALRVLGRDVEYVVYPEEHHGMKSIGRPDRRVDRMERILAWYSRHLEAVTPAPDPAVGSRAAPGRSRGPRTDAGYRRCRRPPPT